MNPSSARIALLHRLLTRRPSPEEPQVWARDAVMALTGQGLRSIRLERGAELLAEAGPSAMVGTERAWELTVPGAESLRLVVGLGPGQDRDEELTLLLEAVAATLETQAQAMALPAALHGRERARRDLEQFAYAASHDLQEPLRMITGYADLLGRRYSHLFEGEAREFLGFLLAGADRMKRLITDLLTYSRVLHSPQRPGRPTDTNAAFLWALMNLQARVKATDASVTHEPLPTVPGDDSQIVQVFSSLLDNSLKFRREVSPRVHLSVCEKEREWSYCLEDNGTGFDPQYSDKVFELFSRLHGREHEGTGMGLALVKRIVERHGGRIWADPTPGVGCRFSFTLAK